MVPKISFHKIQIANESRLIYDNISPKPPSSHAHFTSAVGVQGQQMPNFLVKSF